MIKLDALHIEEMRGIRKLDVDLNRATFAISGPNGSGKSGVVDAIEFGLTGQISRLTGRGTRGLSVGEHGPHVDKSKFPDSAFVELSLYLPSLNKTATLKRTVSAPNKPEILPPDDDIKRILAEVAQHPELMLSRREVLRFILIEPAKRSDEVQAILKLDAVGEARGLLNAARNKLERAAEASTTAMRSCAEALARHLQIPALNSTGLLAEVNKRRKLLRLSEIPELTADTKVDADLGNAVASPEVNKQSALRDIDALSAASATWPLLAQQEVNTILKDLRKLDGDPALRLMLQQRDFFNVGLELVRGIACPLCDVPWASEGDLRQHLSEKIKRSDGARKLHEDVASAGSSLATSATRVITQLVPAHRVALAQGQTAFASLLEVWKADLEDFRASLTTVPGVESVRSRLETGWLATPPEFLPGLAALRQSVAEKSDQGSTLDAQTFLTQTQLRLTDYRLARQDNESVARGATRARVAYETYCAVLEHELNALYDDVQRDFSAFYRTINDDDEATFTAKLTPSEGKLDLDVNFYERGLFPPAAYHSEGHQDGMGVCLYLALMKRLFGSEFTFALFDDVVMSVDSAHRYQFCKLLKTHFAETQFVITTHDRLWAEQMKSAGLVNSKTRLVFHSWTIDTGPLVESDDDIWNEIDRAVAKGKVEAAAAALRRHLEYVARTVAGELSAEVPFRADGQYELGDLLPRVIKRSREVLGKAADAAQSWGNTTAKETATKRKQALSDASSATNLEQWAVNKLVHYNEWANFGRTDFQPVVASFKALLECLRCTKCGAWLYVVPKSIPETLRCGCGETALNLKTKPKGD